jgi:hypothetical protein
LTVIGLGAMAIPGLWVAMSVSICVTVDKLLLNPV